jgi:hypothetical protein
MESGNQGKWVFRNQRWYFVPGTAGAFELAPRPVDPHALTSLVDIEALLGPLRTAVQLFGLPMNVVLFSDPVGGPSASGRKEAEYSQWFEPAWWARLRALSTRAAAVGEEMKAVALAAGGEAAPSRHDSVFGKGTILLEPLSFRADEKRLTYGAVAALGISREELADSSVFADRFGIDARNVEVLARLFQSYLRPAEEASRYLDLFQSLMANFAARVREVYLNRVELAAERARSQHFLLRAENLERQLLRGTGEVERAGRSGGVLTSELSAILESPFIGVTIEDSRYRVRYVNPMLRNTFGNIVGRKCYEAFKGRTAPCHSCPIDLIWEQGQGSTRYATTDPRTGKSFEVLSVPLVGAGGEKMIVEVGIEVTALMKEKDALHKVIDGLCLRNEQLAQMLEQLNAVLLNTSSEIGNLLVENSLFAPNTRQGSEAKGIVLSPERFKQVSVTLEALVAAVSSAGQVSLALATVSRPAPADVPKLAGELVARISDELDGEPVTLRIAVMPEVYCDPGGLSGAIEALVRWVVLSSREGTATKLDISHTMSGRIDSVTQGDRFHIISVSRHNPARGFEDCPGTVEEVSGLPETVDESMDVNLTIASLLVKRMGGALWLHARAETEVTFYFSIPVEPPAR